ncbi:glycosyltransferase family 4 protein [Actinospongicola halichondriae]|uniref:glycosyltransferase family 4 protein n=1 Tax=Actinospongicola halichondriae TaxID=3236844 RepID=UPI003D5B4F9C
MTHLLVTNDFPPKIGGIQTLLWELWRRLDPSTFAVLTTPHEGSSQWDAEQAFRVERTREPVLLPHPGLVRQIDRLAAEIGAETVVLDPALPLGLVGPHLERPYSVLLHGAEVTVPGRLPGSNVAIRRVLRGAARVIAFGGYPAAEAERAAGRPLPMTVVPCGIDSARFRPLDADERASVRARHGLDDGPLVLSLSRLVPRKGMDVLIDASARLADRIPGLQVAIGGSGRDRRRLETRAARTGAPVTFLGRVPEDDLASVYGAADVYAMLCRNRWAGLEQEGFGIVFLEAAAAGVPQIAGNSGGAAEAVVDGVTGLVVGDPHDVVAVEDALERLLTDPALRSDMAAKGRERAIDEFDYDRLAPRLAAAIEGT